MDIEALNGAADEAAPQNDLRATLEAAVAAQIEPAPDEETAEERREREYRRDQVGRFATPDKAVEKAAQEAQDKPKPGEPTKPQAEPQKAASEAEKPTDAPMQIRPPVGWPPAAKAAFDKLPTEVREAVARREVEVNNGLAKLQEYKSIEPFMEIAKRAGRDLGQALTVYERIDRTFGQNGPVAGVEAVCENIGVDPRVLVAEMARRYGMTLTPGQPGQQPAPQQRPQAQQPQVFRDPRVDEILAERQQQQIRQAEQEVTTFWNDPANRYAENVAEIMASLINQAKARGQSLPLKEAYEEACWMHPDVRPLLINEQIAVRTAPSNGAPASAVSRARAAAKATVGAPAGGTPPAQAPQSHKTVREALEAAVAQHSV